MKVLAVLNEKGGVGKTTLAVNLAGAAHLAGQRTLLLDLNCRQGSASDWCASRQEGSRLEGLRAEPVEGVLTLPQLDQLSQGYDLVVMDGSPGLDKATASAAALADVIVIPVRPSQWNLWAADNAVRLFHEVAQTRAEMDLPPARHVFVLNQVREGTILAREAPKSLSGPELAPVQVGMREAFSQCEGTGETVQTREQGSDAAQEIEALYQYLMRPAPRGERRPS